MHVKLRLGTNTRTALPEGRFDPSRSSSCRSRRENKVRSPRSSKLKCGRGKTVRCPTESNHSGQVVEQSTRRYEGMCYGCVERDESEVGRRIYPSSEVVAATRHRFDTPRRFRPFAMVPPPASHNSGTAGGPARATVPVEPPYFTCTARAEGPRPPINQDQCEHHFTKLRQEPNEVVQVLLDQKAAGATRGQSSCCPEVGWASV